jgi:hypothetical protein
MQQIYPDRNPVTHNLVQKLLKKFKETGSLTYKPCLDCPSTIKWFVKLLHQKCVMVLRIQPYMLRISYTKEQHILKKGQGSAGNIHLVYLLTDLHKDYFVVSSALRIISHQKQRAAILQSINALT